MSSRWGGYALWNLWLPNIFIIKKRVAFIISKTIISVILWYSPLWFNRRKAYIFICICIFWDLDLTLCDQIPHGLSPWPNIEKNCLRHQWMFWLKKWVTWKLPPAKLPPGWFPPDNSYPNNSHPGKPPPGKLPPGKSPHRFSPGKFFIQPIATWDNCHPANLIKWV